MRFAELERDTLTERQRETYDRIANGPRQGVHGPFVAWLRAPEFADRAEAMGNYLRFESALPDSVRELAVLMIAKHWRAAFVWSSHHALALNAGLSQEAIEAIRSGGSPQLPFEADQTAYAFVSELLNDKRVSEQTWREGIRHLGEQGVVDLLGFAGYYTMVVMTVVATEQGAELTDPFRG